VNHPFETKNPSYKLFLFLCQVKENLDEEMRVVGVAGIAVV
jgi:hypothetical protein